ncbi:hypothetical protein V6N12_025242 [Hibiscus sabdariffa]|uniref:RNase H type-1 domain-containing protein n=1 Tax=Hibiscus sabdariffa TaxID=183260 RepID=A0ABR2BLX0_9ROSI
MSYRIVEVNQQMFPHETTRSRKLVWGNSGRWLALLRLSCIKYCWRQALPVPGIAKINKVRVECDHLKVVQTALSRIADFIKKQWEVKVVHISPDINKFTVFCREFKALSWCNFHNHRP